MLEDASGELEILMADIIEFVVMYKEYFIGFIVVIFVIKLINQVHNDYKEDEEDELEKAIRKRDEETVRRFDERYDKYLREKYLGKKRGSKIKADNKTGYVYSTSFDDDSSATLVDSELWNNKNDHEPDMIDLVEEHMEAFQRTVNDELNQEQVLLHERDTWQQMEEFDRQNDYFYSHDMDDYQIEDSYQNEDHFHDDNMNYDNDFHDDYMNDHY